MSKYEVMATYCDLCGIGPSNCYGYCLSCGEKAHPVTPFVKSLIERIDTQEAERIEHIKHIARLQEMLFAEKGQENE